MQGRGWADIDARFDLARTPQEAFRFGWVVLLDPRRPSARPRKLTMLGRLGHDRLDASIADDGRAVIRLSDGLPGGHDYVYVSQWPVDHGPLAGVHNRRLLTTGTLYVVPPGASRPDDPDAWVPLVTDTTSYVPGPLGGQRPARHPARRAAAAGGVGLTDQAARPTMLRWE